MIKDNTVDVEFWLAEELIPVIQPRCTHVAHQRHCHPTNDRCSLGHPDLWHLEIIEEGRAQIESKGRRYLLKKHLGVLTPPGLQPATMTTLEITSLFSLHFQVAWHNQLPDERCILSGIAQKSILQAIGDNIFGTSNHPAALTNSLLDALVATLCTRTEEQSSAHPHDEQEHKSHSPLLITKIKRFIVDHSGKNLYVRDLADRFQLTRGHLSVLFQKETGIPLKKYIDQQRAKCVARRLAFTGKSITEIADDMAFADSFTLSRFFKRVVGVSPRSYRKLVWQTIERDYGGEPSHRIRQHLLHQEQARPMVLTRHNSTDDLVYQV